MLKRPPRILVLLQLGLAACQGEQDARLPPPLVADPDTAATLSPPPDLAEQLATPVLEDPNLSEPKLILVSGVPRLALPPTAFAALQGGDANFQPWAPGHYYSYIFENDFYDFDETQSMSVVLGDFNGDRRVDVVMDGPSGSDIVRITLLSTDRGYGFAELDRRLARAQELESTQNIEFLSFAGPGYYAEPVYLGSASVQLLFDAFVQIYFEKASSLYYLLDGKWVELALSD